MRPPRKEIGLAVIGCGTIGRIRAEFARDYPGIGWLGLCDAAAIALYFLMERTRLGAMIRAGVDDPQMARAVGIPVSNLFTIVFCLGAGIAGAGGVLGGPI